MVVRITVAKKHCCVHAFRWWSHSISICSSGVLRKINYDSFSAVLNFGNKSCRGKPWASFGMIIMSFNEHFTNEIIAKNWIIFMLAKHFPLHTRQFTCKHDFKIPYMQEPLQINLPSSSFKCFLQKPLQINVLPSYLMFCAITTSGAKCAKATSL